MSHYIGGQQRCRVSVMGVWHPLRLAAGTAARGAGRMERRACLIVVMVVFSLLLLGVGEQRFLIGAPIAHAEDLAQYIPADHGSCFAPWTNLGSPLTGPFYSAPLLGGAGPWGYRSQSAMNMLRPEWTQCFYYRSGNTVAIECSDIGTGETQCGACDLVVGYCYPLPCGQAG